MEAGLNTGPNPVSFTHPIFDSVRRWVDRIGHAPTLDLLNAFSEEQDLKTESGRPIRFVPPSPSDPYYEVHLFETGRVQTRPDSKHDLFNALAWLAFPKTKARINAMHAAEIPRENGKRGRLRDMLTIFDEGGAIVSGDVACERQIRHANWQDLFLRHHQDFRITVVGHAVLEQALDPYPGITCKVLFADRNATWMTRLRTGSRRKGNRRATCRRCRYSATPGGCRRATHRRSTPTRATSGPTARNNVPR